MGFILYNTSSNLESACHRGAAIEIQQSMAVGKWKKEGGGGASTIVPKATLAPAELPKVIQKASKRNTSPAPYQLLYTRGEGVVAAKARSTWRYLVASIPSYATPE